MLPALPSNLPRKSAPAFWAIWIISIGKRIDPYRHSRDSDLLSHQIGLLR